METNNHIIVGEPRRCLCGTYEIRGVKIPVSCSNIIAAVEHVRYFMREGEMIHAAVSPLIVDCAETESQNVKAEAP